jgi:hypothetical protein
MLMIMNQIREHHKKTGRVLHSLADILHLVHDFRRPHIASVQFVNPDRSFPPFREAQAAEERRCQVQGDLRELQEEHRFGLGVFEEAPPLRL